VGVVVVAKVGVATVAAKVNVDKATADFVNHVFVVFSPLKVSVIRKLMSRQR
jgi:hypothetical protein